MVDTARLLRVASTLVLLAGCGGPANAPATVQTPTQAFNASSGDPQFRLDGLQRRTVELINAAKFDEGEQVARESLALAERSFGPDHPEIATSLNSLASLLQDQNRLAEAEPLYRRALAIREKALPEGHPAIATSLNNLALLLRAQNRFAEAEPLYRRALAIKEQALREGHPDIALSLSNLAVLLKEQNRLAEAEPLHRRALAIFEKALPQDHPDIAKSLNNLAALLRPQSRFAEAEPLYRRALAIDEKALPEGHPTIANSLNNLALLLQDQTRLAEAEPLYRRALAIKEQVLTEGHPDIATSLISLGSLLQSQNRLAEAVPLYRRALVIREKARPEGHPDIAQSLAFLASIDATQGRLVEAQAGFARAAAIRATPENRDLASQARRTFFGHARSSIILASTSDPPRAMQLRREAFKAMQWPGRGGTSRALAAAGAQRSTADPALRALARGYEDVLQKVKDLDRQLLAALGEVGEKRDPAGIAALRADYVAASRELARLQQELVSRFPAYASLADPEPLAIAEVQALLGPEEALVTFMLGGKDEKGFVFLVDREQFVVDWLPAGDPLGTAKALRCAAAVGGCPQVAERAFDVGAAHELYKSLLGPVAARLKAKKQLIIAPDGPMLGFPFHLLVEEAPDRRLTGAVALRRAKWLMRDHAITVLPNVASLNALRGLGGQSVAARPFLGIGDPVIGTGGAMTCATGDIRLASAGSRSAPRGVKGLATTELLRGATMIDGQAIAPVEQVRALARLPDTRCELEAIAGTLGGGADDLLLAEAATEARVKSMSDAGKLKDYRVLAFGTHGLVAGEAGAAEPALVLTPPKEGTTLDDGLLTASEVATLKLDAEWTILSACNTAAGDGSSNAENLGGLARAFFYAGAKSLLVSHWPVYSDAAVKLTTSAFAELAKEPRIGRAEALRRSMLAMLDDGPEEDAHPSVWAPFFLVGEGAPGR